MQQKANNNKSQLTKRKRPFLAKNVTSRSLLRDLLGHLSLYNRFRLKRVEKIEGKNDLLKILTSR